MLPSDPYMLLSVINTKLRDLYPSLDALCDEMDEDKSAIVEKLSKAGFDYDPDRNQFR